MEPLVSILIPAYNSQEWIAGAIESALAQTWPKKEIIVVDDGSADQSLQVAKRFASRNVQVITQTHQGASVARNTAYSACQGDYIQWLDADDLLDPEKVKNQVVRADSCPSKRILLSGAWGVFSYRIHKARFSPSPLWCSLSPLEWLVRKIGSNLQMQTDNWLVNRELSEAAGPWDARLWKDNDGEYFCRVLLASDGVEFVPDAKSYWRKVGFKSVSYAGGSHKKLESMLLSTKLHIQYLLSLENSERTRLACVNLIQRELYEYYPYRPDIAEELQQIILELGGKPEEPRLSWKYNWLVNLLGWSRARKAQMLLSQTKANMVIAWDKTMFNLESRMGRSATTKGPQ